MRTLLITGETGSTGRNAAKKLLEVKMPVRVWFIRKISVGGAKHPGRDIASFKTPGLCNVLITEPYFHDGSQATLWDVVDHYNKGDGIKDPWLDEDMQPLALTEPEIDDLVEFMAALTSSQYQQQGIKELERQRAISRTNRPLTVRAFGPKPVQPKPSRMCMAP